MRARSSEPLRPADRSGSTSRAHRAAVSPMDLVTRLDGVGPAVAAALGRRATTRVVDLLWHLPSGHDDLRTPIDVAEAVAKAGEGERLAVRGIVRSAGFLRLGRRRMLRVMLADEANRKLTLTCWWFFAAHGVLAHALPETSVTVVGRVTRNKRGKGAQMAHPDLLGADGSAPGVRSRYSRLAPEIGPERTRRLIATALAELAATADPVPDEISAREGFGALGGALRAVHAPHSLDDAALLRKVAERLAWAEAFARVWVRVRQAPDSVVRALASPPSPDSIERLRAELGFVWTAGQAAAIATLERELASDEPMRRLLLGDVGSGKTAVALAGAAQCVAAGAQVAILAPTQALVLQYVSALEPLRRATGARCAALTSALAAKEKTATLRALARGEIDVVVGTHALLDERVELPELGLCVVDEQQRLGVAQRLLLSRRTGQRPHLLTLSATPIPRTLSLALRGELPTTLLDELPSGRVAVGTSRHAAGEFDAVALPLIELALSRAERVFVVAPRIADDAEESAPSVERRLAWLQGRFGAQVTSAHGLLRSAELERALGSFRAGRTPILVGTSVVEVGLDVPEATLMIVDGAEHFGLGQLHQLRGRVGRSHRPSRCLLLHSASVGESALARLDALVVTARGADIARLDLELRGEGDLGGARQSGESGLLWLDRFRDAAWLARIADDVARISADDAELARPEHVLLAHLIARMSSCASAREEAG